MVLFFLACTETDTDSGAPPETGDSDPGVITTVEGGWSGDGQFLLLRSDWGGWSDGCYGGTIDPPHEASDGAFDWPAAFFVGAGSPDPRPARAVGEVTDDQLTLSILEEDGTPFWGPWTLYPDPSVVDIASCD